MLLRVDTISKTAERVRGQRLASFRLDERAFQQILFNSLDRLIPDDELLLISQSRRWQEEPDLMALDAKGRLYIFELKVWEARSENILQVFRYGQLFGSYRYEELDRIYRSNYGGQSLDTAHRAKFDVTIPKDAYNQDQVFVVLTNGIDVNTREAIRYWRSRELDVRPWIYRVYGDPPSRLMVELLPFRVADNPYEDLAEGYYILHTNYANDPRDDHDMVTNKKAAAYYAPWKFKIERLSYGDVVFLYRASVGIVAFGTASGQLQKLPYHEDPTQPDEEYSMKLNNFRLLTKPFTAAEIKQLTGVNYRFMSTMFGIDARSGRLLVETLQTR